VKNNIYIQDNFFEDNFFKKLQEEVVRLEFKSRYKYISETQKEQSPLQTKYQRTYHHVQLPLDSPVVEQTIYNIKEFFNYSISNIESNFLLSFPNTPPFPHQDALCTHNCLIYLVGDSLTNNGTGFFEKQGEDLNLHTHIGFKQNRAIFFDSKLWHSHLQFAGNATPRYVMANFIDVGLDEK